MAGKDPFSSHTQKFIKVERGFLSNEELLSIENMHFQIERLQQVKDLFIFSCYSGLTYIDVMKLTPDNVRTGFHSTTKNTKFGSNSNA